MGQASLPPGFRFCPTDEELVGYYLKRKVYGWPLQSNVIPEVDLYKCEPWDMPDKSCLQSRDSKWYFFTPKDGRYVNGSGPNRATEAGYWKVTGNVQPILACFQTVGIKNTLVFYRGCPPHGERTDWVMHEYTLEDVNSKLVQDSYVLCQVFQKNSPAPQNGELYGAPSRTKDLNEHPNAQFGVTSSSEMECDSLVTQPINACKETNVKDKFFGQVCSSGGSLALLDEETLFQEDLVAADDDELHRFLLTHIYDSDDLKFNTEENGLQKQPANDNQDDIVNSNEISACLLQHLHDSMVGEEDVSKFCSFLSDVHELHPDILEGDFLELNDLLTPLELD